MTTGASVRTLIGVFSLALVVLQIGAACGPIDGPHGGARSPSGGEVGDDSRHGDAPAERGREAGSELSRATHILATERGGQGARLIFIAEDGRRTAELTPAASVPIRDNSPAWSPDGAWVVFASSRGRGDLLRTSLWIAAAQPGGLPRRLTVGDFDDRDPAWLPDGGGLIFASDRGGSYDLWRLPLDHDRYPWPVAAGMPEQVTDRPRHALQPAVTPDGDAIIYTEVDLARGQSELWRWRLGMATDAEPEQLTDGPADAMAAISPDGARVAFVGAVTRERGRPHDDGPQNSNNDGAGNGAVGTHGASIHDADLFLIDMGGGGRRRLIDEPLAIQSDPAWSNDGTLIFATSVYRSIASGKPVLSSLTVVDLTASVPVLRALHDPQQVRSRATPALAPRLRMGPSSSGSDAGAKLLDRDILLKNPPYNEALARAVEADLIRREIDDGDRAP